MDWYVKVLLSCYLFLHSESYTGIFRSYSCPYPHTQSCQFVEAPLLALLRLHQSLLIDTIAADPNLLDAAIRTNAEVVAAHTDILPYVHPVQAVYH